MNKYLLFYLSMIITFLLGCKKDTFPTLNKRIYESNTLFIIEANNNLRKEAIETINEIELGYTNNENHVVLVLIKNNSYQSTLLKISKDYDLNIINSDTIKIYNNSLTTAEILGKISLECQNKFPAKHYGLILWSHSTSWFPSKKEIKTKSFGDDNGIDIDIKDLARELPKNYNYIIFDSCNMASLEVLYEFKDNCNYILSSPSEVLSSGFPYRNIMKYIVEANLSEVALKYFEYYYNFIGSMQSATISLVDTKSLANLSRVISEAITHEEIEKFNTIGVQRMDFTLDFPIETYDFGSFIKNNFNLLNQQTLNSELNKVIIFKRNTPYFNGVFINEFSGITCYIPTKDNSINYYYKGLKWVIDSKINILL